MLMSKLFRQMPWAILLPVAILLGLAPFRPEPHLLEKLRLLAAGQLVGPMAIFDLFLHGLPVLLVLGKVLLGRQASPSIASRK